MIQAHSGPLPALIGYYTRLEADPDGAVPGFGFSREKIHLQAVIEPDGSLAALDDIRDLSERGKPIPKLLLVPYGGGRSGTGVKPSFCWDHTGYTFGRDNKGNSARAEMMFAAFRELHLSMRGEVGDDDAYEALCRFLERWDPAKAEALPNWEEVSGLKVVFKLRGREAFVHQGKSVRGAWLQRASAGLMGKDGHRGFSLVSGEDEEVARLHEPAIKGITDPGGQAEKKLASFDKPAFTSYGKAQSYNSPVGVHDAFRYTTALNRLLTDGSRRVLIGDATVVFWADREEGKVAEEVFAAIFGEQAPKDEGKESGKVLDWLRQFFYTARQGRPVDEVSVPDVPFYILGLSPNASRINVRFWLAGTVSQFARRLAQHLTDLEMVGGRDGDPPLVIRRLLDETVPAKNGWPDRDRIAPQLAGEVARAVLSQLPYPQALLAALVRRIRVEGFVTNDKNASSYRIDWQAAAHRRAAILKAYLVRNRKQEVPVALDRDHPEEAYNLGRLFAALEKTQEDATDGQLNSTIKDRYFGAAGATPATIFPRLMRLHQHHMNKLENVGLRVTREKLIGEICGRLRRFPLHLSLEKQGLFYIAYYQQRQDFFTKKNETAKEVTGE